MSDPPQPEHVAFNEAGHAVADILLRGAVTTLEEVTIEPRRGYVGIAWYAVFWTNFDPMTGRTFTGEALHAFIITSLARPMAEWRASGRSIKDIRKTHQWADYDDARLLIRYSLEARSPSWQRS